MKTKVLIIVSAFIGYSQLVYSQNVGVDVALPIQKLDVAGGLRIGSTTNGVAGSIRWNGTNFQAHDGSQWTNFGDGPDHDWLVSGANMSSEVTGNVGIGTPSPATKLHVVGTARVSALNINGIYTLPTVDGSSGFILTTNGSGTLSWLNPALLGDITAVIAGNGLINGGTSGDVTLDVNPGDGIQIVTDQVQVRASDLDGNGISVSSNNFNVNTGDGLVISSDQVIVDASALAGNGLVANSNNLDVNVDGLTLQIAANVLRVKADGILSSHIAPDVIVAADIATGGVATAEILDGTILPIDIAAGGNKTVLSTISGVVGWNNPALLTTVLQDGDADTKISVDVANADEDHIRMSTLGVERLTIDNAGEIGIGTLTPDRNLHVAHATGGKIMVTSSGATAVGETLGEIQFDSEATTTPSSVDASALIRGIASENHGNSNKGGHLAFLTKAGGGVSGAAAAAEHMRITNNGNVGIGITNPTYKLHVNGKIRTNAINETSDGRLKKEVAKIANASELISALDGVTYYWRTDEFPNLELEDRLQYGLIAQEVEKVVPELVNTDSEGWKSVEYTHLVPILLEALKEQQQTIEALKQKNNQFSASLDKLASKEARNSMFIEQLIAKGMLDGPEEVKAKVDGAVQDIR